MDSSDICRASSNRGVGSFRSTFTNNYTMEAFSNSSHHAEDDEEALKWAALEKLPTYLRIKRGILNEQEIDVNNLGMIERRNLVERLVKIAEDDNEKFLLKLRDRIERYVNYKTLDQMKINFTKRRRQNLNLASHPHL